MAETQDTLRNPYNQLQSERKISIRERVCLLCHIVCHRDARYTREREREREREEIVVRGIEWQRGKIHSEAGRECLNREYLKGPVKVLLLRY